MSYETHAEPIKLGILMDWVVPEDHPKERVDDWFLPLELVFGEGLKQGVIDRPVELVVRQCWGLPKGSVKAVVDAYAELVEEGCLAVFGPSISDNCIPMREAIEDRFHVPAISCSGSDEWLGEWTFALPQGSMTDEPILWAQILAKGGHTQVGALIEQSLVGESYIRNFRKACRERGIQIVAEEWVAQTAHEVESALRNLHEAKATALVHCGFGFGVFYVNGSARVDAVGSDSDHGDGLPERLVPRSHVERHARLDRRRPVRREQPRGTGVPRPVRSHVRSPARMGAATREPGLRHGAPPRVRGRASAQSSRRQGGARTGEDGAGSSWLSRYLSVVRKLDETRLDGGGLSRGADARP